MECEFCKNKFNSKYVLSNHQKRAKYCIEIQKKNGINNETELFKCQDCGIEIAKNSKDRHLSVYKSYLRFRTKNNWERLTYFWTQIWTKNL